MEAARSRHQSCASSGLNLSLRRQAPSASAGSGNGMRGIVLFAIMTAAMAVVDAAFFEGRYLSDLETAITSLASLSMQIGRH